MKNAELLDNYTIAVIKEDQTVGHNIPKEISIICFIFIQRGGSISCKVLGTKKYTDGTCPCLIKLREQVKRSKSLLN